MAETKPARRGLFAWLRGEPGEAAPAAEAERAHLEPVRPERALHRRLLDEGEIARGGMSTIRRVLDHNLLRRVAMKVLDPEVARDPREVQRFIEEAQITGQLEHPYIPPVHEVGSEDGVHYFTMKLVPGQTLEALLHDPAYSVEKEEQLDRALQVLVKVCEAVSFAHERGVLHLDLKPANVMVGKHGQVHVMDWGVARLMGEDRPSDLERVALRPRTGEVSAEERIVGTANYMSPEQAQGITAHLDPRSDVFSLGGVLYAILTGRPPYVGDDPEAVWRQAQAGEVPEPEAVSRAKLPAKLCRVAMRALRKEQAERYPSAAELGEAVEDYLHGHGRYPVLRFPAGTVITEENSPGDAVYVVISGRCQVYRTVGGQKRVLAELGSGDSFGESSAVTGGPRTASVAALEPVAVLAVSREALAQELGRGAWLGPIMRGLATRFRAADAEARRLTEEARLGAFTKELLLAFALHATGVGSGSLREAPWSAVSALLARRLGKTPFELMGMAQRLEFVALDLERDRVMVMLPPG